MMNSNEIIALVKRWQDARKTIVKDSIFPIGNTEYRKHINELSEAESALAAIKMPAGNDP